ncbi:hypothetical protein B0J11DRAFT_506811 [Dendryphion nanum]|uniref:Uncharacterized protein n=1 Tax=Dendryphion nanum TaxID=256645 RepID=A0A9P9DQ73_9PLEO|nr:hypothetical protein B0J11DRAFT_506811 [Dendryphion nanum]
MGMVMACACAWHGGYPRTAGGRSGTAGRRGPNATVPGPRRGERDKRVINRGRRFSKVCAHCSQRSAHMLGQKGFGSMRDMSGMSDAHPRLKQCSIVSMMLHEQKAFTKVPFPDSVSKRWVQGRADQARGVRKRI